MIANDCCAICRRVNQLRQFPFVDRHCEVDWGETRVVRILLVVVSPEHPIVLPVFQCLEQIGTSILEGS